MKNMMRFTSMMMVGMSVMIGVSGLASAQQRPRESNDGSRKVVPVPREPQENMNVDVWFDKQCGSPYRQGEKIMINFRAASEGYLTVYDIDTSGQVSVLFPNKHQPDNYVRGGQTYTVPDRSYSYDLIVEGRPGIEYVDAVVSADPYYHWDYRQGEPRWVREWGINNRTYTGRAGSGYKNSAEYKNRPQELGQEGEQSLARNFEFSRTLREDIRSKIIVTPRQSQDDVQMQQVAYDYGTASCYFYVTAAYQQPVAQQPVQTLPSRQQYLEQQQQQFQRIPGFDARFSSGRLIVTMPSTILFDTDSYALRYEASRDLDRVVEILLNYQETVITVAGHTDSVGNEGYNQRLSEYRAQSVANYLVSRGVPQQRIRAVGYGESMPIASNSNESGRQRNRRVELDISVNPQYGN